MLWLLTIHWGLARQNFKSHESRRHISGQKRKNRRISYALLTRGQSKEKNGILNGHTAQGGRPKRPLPLCVAPGNQSIQNLSIRTFLPSLEPGPSRAGYFPRYMLLLTTTARGKGLAFTKNNPPDFGLLFLAQFARFSIRTETEATVHTHSQTNRHLHFCPSRSGLWKFGFVGALEWSIFDQVSDPAAEPVTKVCM